MRRQSCPCVFRHDFAAWPFLRFFWQLLASSLAPRGTARKALPEPAPVKRDQPLPMSFRCRLVVAPALREGEAMMHARLQLQFARGTRAREQAAQFLHHR